MVLKQFSQVPEGSLFIIIDLMSNIRQLNIRQLMISIEEEVTRHELGIVLHSVGKDIVELHSNILIPHIIRQELLVGGDWLIGRSSTKFYASAILRQMKQK